MKKFNMPPAATRLVVLSTWALRLFAFPMSQQSNGNITQLLAAAKGVSEGSAQVLLPPLLHWVTTTSQNAFKPRLHQHRHASAFPSKIKASAHAKMSSFGLSLWKSTCCQILKILEWMVLSPKFPQRITTTTKLSGIYLHSSTNMTPMIYKQQFSRLMLPLTF